MLLSMPPDRQRQILRSGKLRGQAGEPDFERIADISREILDDDRVAARTGRARAMWIKADHRAVTIQLDHVAGGH